MSTQNNQKSPISEDLDTLTCDAIGMALDNLAEGDGIWPTLVLLYNDNLKEFFVFEDDGLDICLTQARDSVKELGHDSKCYALFYDGFFESDNNLTDNALVVEFGERGSDKAYSAVIAYGNAGMGDKFWYDEPIPGGEEKLLF